MTKPIPLAQHLFRRLRQLGCHSVHGVPGDFFLRALDHVRPAGVTWIGNASELGAGYAADGCSLHDFGGRDLELPPQTQVVASSIWYSIGHMLPAAQGIALAKRDHDLPGRTILFEGDGRFQVTCQALSDIIRLKLDVTIFIVNNRGYGYERWLNGMEAEYNDVASWRYSDAPRFFDAMGPDPTYPVTSVLVKTWTELERVLAEEGLHDGRGLKVVEVVMNPTDVPEKSMAGLMKRSEALGSAR